MASTQMTLSPGKFRTSFGISGLRWSLLRELVTVLVVTLLLIGAAVMFFVAQSEQAVRQDRQREAAFYASEAVSSYMENVQNHLNMAAALPAAQMTENPDLLQKFVEGNQSVLEIVRTDRSGEVIAQAGYGQLLLSKLLSSDQIEWFQEASAGRYYISDLQLSSVGEPYLITSIPSIDGGVVAARLRMELLWDLIAQIQFGKSGHVFVITREGQLIAHEFPQVVLANKPLSTQPEMNEIVAAGDHQWMGTYTNNLGEKVLSITQPVWGTGWIVVSELPFNDSFSISRRALMVFVFGILMFGVLATFMTFTALQRLVLDPIEALRSTLQWVGRGEFDHQVQIYRHDEVGQVAQGFNEMVASLNKRDNELAAKTAALATEFLEHKKTQDELEQLNRTLEQRVKDRTSELEKITTDLTRSNNELQEFAYVASHDLQEPLRKVRTFGDRLVEKYSSVLDVRAQDYIARMQNGAARMQVLIDALLTYSRVATNAQPFVALDLKQVAQDVVNDLEQQIERVGGEVQLGELDVIYSDPLQMRQLLQNLISNGLKFHKPDEKPLVKVYGRWVYGSNAEEPDQRSYRLVVQDNGIGIPAEYATQIFQVFQRLHGRSEYEGTGIGLAICRKIVERHRGTIVVMGEPGEGASFVITLPQLQPSQLALEEK